jgi:ribosomal protein S18 acetylase RimI-like enzyme
MVDELARAFAFMARGDMAGDSTELSRFGTTMRSSRVPMRQDSNYLLVGTSDASAAELAAELVDLGLRVVVVRDEATGRRLADEFEELGWQSHRHVVMAHRGGATKPADASIAVEVGEATLRPVRRRAILAAPWGGEELAEQLVRAKLLISERVDTHFFAVLADGEVAACADLYLDGDTGQIEDVLTLEEHRNRGLASALVVRTVDEARRAGATLVFLVAHETDWPWRLYERLGFETIGRYYKFFA